jgi:hypothetical protein
MMDDFKDMSSKYALQKEFIKQRELELDSCKKDLLAVRSEMEEKVGERETQRRKESTERQMAENRLRKEAESLSKKLAEKSKEVRLLAYKVSRYSEDSKAVKKERNVLSAGKHEGKAQVLHQAGGAGGAARDPQGGQRPQETAGRRKERSQERHGGKRRES